MNFFSIFSKIVRPQKPSPPPRNSQRKPKIPTPPSKTIVTIYNYVPIMRYRRKSDDG